MWRWVLLLGFVFVTGCAPLVRVRRALAPETFVTPATPTGQHASVIVETGLRSDPPVAYAPEIAFERDGETWIRPMVVANRGRLEVIPSRPDATVDVYIRHVYSVVDPRDFVPVIARSGTLQGEMSTAIRFDPQGPLGDAPLRLELRDLNNVYSDDRLEDGDLLLVAVGAPGEEPDRYLFRALRFGMHTRGAAAVLLRTRLPGVDLPPEKLTTAIAASLAIRYRFRPQTPFATFVSERTALIASLGIGSGVFAAESEGSKVDTVIDALLIGGGIEGFRMFNLQILGNLTSIFERDVRPNWTLAVGFDAVQLARFASHIDARLWSDQPLHEDRKR